MLTRGRLDPGLGAVASPRPSLFGSDLRALSPRGVEQGRHAGARQQIARSRLEHGHRFRIALDGGEGTLQLQRLHAPGFDAVSAAALESPTQHLTPARADGEAPRDVQKPLSALLLERLPELVGPSHQGNVEGMLEIGLANHAGSTVGGSQGVRRVVPVQPEHAKAPAGEGAERGASHHSQADHDRVVRLRHRQAARAGAILTTRKVSPAQAANAPRSPGDSAAPPLQEVAWRWDGRAR